MIEYMRSNNYGVDYNEELQVYVVVDRNGRRVCDKSWDTAAGAINWGEMNYRTLI